MDQLKEFLRQCIKYRFWISIGFAALFAIIAYFVGSGPVQAKAKAQTDAITGAKKEAEGYTSRDIPTAAYKPIVEEKTQVLTTDVHKAWRQLYQRQAPLLDWPEIVQKRFQTWGRKWPEEVDPNAVRFAIIDYIEAYPKYVDAVYKTFNPFDYESGKGVVSAQPKEMLLRPSVFDINSPPDLGKVWSAQERLWIQRTALDVVAQVNKNAKDWDSAIIKQINMLEVGNAMAQDQRSLAKSEQLEEAEAIVAPGTEQTETTDASGGGMGGMLGGAGMAMPGMGGSGMMGNAGVSESVYFVKPEGAADQYKILPIMMSVLVDQDHIQDFLVELENSPMSIQVMDIEIQRPMARVTKPEKGAVQSFSSYGESMMGGMMGSMMAGRMAGRGMSGYGGMMGGYASMMGRMMGGSRGMEDMMSRGMGMGMGMGMGGAAAKQGTDKRGQDRSKKREEELKAVEKAKGPTLFDPYYDIVEVKVFGQARFYNFPPAETEEEKQASPGETAADEAAADETKGEAAKAETPKADAPKAEAPKAETPTAETPKADVPKAEAPKAEAPKAEAPKAEAPKAPAPKAEAPKAPAPKAEAPKAPAPKAEAPKAEAPRQ